MNIFFCIERAVDFQALFLFVFFLYSYHVGLHGHIVNMNIYTRLVVNFFDMETELIKLE